jgi:Rab-GTPase-TBC domain/Rhodanese-like domain
MLSDTVTTTTTTTTTNNVPPPLEIDDTSTTVDTAIDVDAAADVDQLFREAIESELKERRVQPSRIRALALKHLEPCLNYTTKRPVAERSPTWTSSHDENTTNYVKSDDSSGMIDMPAVPVSVAVSVVEENQMCVKRTIPDDLRASIWTVLLGSHGKDESSYEVWDKKLDLPNQKVIRMDCDRTRPGEEEFEVNNAQLRDKLELMLTFYCKSRGVSYKQGLNEALAPFLVVFDESKHAPGSVCNAFYALISKFLPSIFNDHEFESLQCIMRVFNMLLKYHDPKLCTYLDSHDILPELYATPWFITLFARKMSLPVVCRLWDIYIIEDDPFLQYFVALTLLIRNHNKIVSSDHHALPQILSSLVFASVDDVDQVVRLAKHFRSRTPVSVRERLYDISFKITNASLIRKISNAIEAHPCLTIPAIEVVQRTFHEHLEDRAIKYIILDCRTEEEFQYGHIPRAINLPPTTLDDFDAMEAAMRNFSDMKGCHFCFLSAGGGTLLQDLCSTTGPAADLDDAAMAAAADDDLKFNDRLKRKRQPPPTPPSQQQARVYTRDAASLFIMHFLQAGFEHVSRCEGGFEACHQIVMRPGSKHDLIDHVAQKCEVCSPGWKTSASNRIKAVGTGIMSGLRRFGLMAAASAMEVHSPDAESASPVDAASNSSSLAPPANPKKQARSLTPPIGAMTASNAPDTSVSLDQPNRQGLFSRMAAKVRSRSSSGARPRAMSSDTDAAARRTSSDGKTLSLGDRIKARLRSTKRGKNGTQPTVDDSQLNKWIANDASDILLRAWQLDPTIQFYSCHFVVHGEKSDDGHSKLLPRVLAITPGYVMCLEVEFPDAVLQMLQTGNLSGAALPGRASVRSKHRIVDLDRITSRKKVKNLLSFHWNEVSENQAPRKDHYIVHQQQDCLQLVRSRYEQLNPMM